jgi:predicted RNase H-like nuclease (RuvC/YqgF family)
MTDDLETSSTAKRKSAPVGRGAAPSAKKSSSKSQQTTNAAPQAPEVSSSTLELALARLRAYGSEIERLKAENLNLKRTVRQMERRIMRSEHKDD